MGAGSPCSAICEHHPFLPPSIIRTKLQRDFLAILLGLLVICPARTITAADQADYKVSGVSANDRLNVRSGPGANFKVVTTLPNGAGHIRITGDIVNNGGNEWVPISFPDGKGWTRAVFLTPHRQDTPAAPEGAKPSVAATGQAVPRPERQTAASLIAFRPVDNGLLVEWVGAVPKEMGTYRDKPIAIRIARRSASDTKPQPRDLKLLDTILANLPSIISSAEKEISRHNREAETNYVDDPEISFGMNSERDVWFFDVEDKKEEDTLMLAFDGAKFKEIADSPF